MKLTANQLQSLIATNAAKITSKHAMLNLCVNSARSARTKGQTSVMVYEFDQAAGFREQLGLLHSIQQKLQTELKHVYRMDRIKAKLAFLADAGWTTPMVTGPMTSLELERAIDRFVFEAKKAA